MLLYRPAHVVVIAQLDAEVFVAPLLGLFTGFALLLPAICVLVTHACSRALFFAVNFNEQIKYLPVELTLSYMIDCAAHFTYSKVNLAN